MKRNIFRYLDCHENTNNIVIYSDMKWLTKEKKNSTLQKLRYKRPSELPVTEASKGTV